MDEKKKYFLRKGTKIGNPGLPGGTLEAKDDFKEIDKKYFPVIGGVFDYLMSQGKIVDADGMAEIQAEEKKAEEAAADEEEKAKEEAAAKKKAAAEKLANLKKECEDLEIPLPEKVTAKALEKLIADKKAELEAGPENGTQD